VEQAAGGEQPVVDHRVRQPLGVDAGVDPPEQAARLGGEVAAVRLGQTDRARPGGVEAMHHALGMAAQRPLLQAVRQRQLAGARRRQRRQQLGVDEAVDQGRGRGEVADAPVRRQDLGEAGDVDRALEGVERRQARRVRRREVRVGVVLDDVKAVLVGEPEHLVRGVQAERHAGRVVQHRDSHVEPRPFAGGLRLDQAAHRRDVGPVAAARHRQHAHAERGHPGVLDRPAGLVDEHAVAGAQQGAGDDVEAHGWHRRW
jgi:hypothetical protein